MRLTVLNFQDDKKTKSKIFNPYNKVTLGEQQLMES